MSIIGDVISGVLGANAAGDAAGAIEGGTRNATSAIQTGQQQALGAITGATSTATTNAAPYTTLGAGGANSLAALLAPGGSLTTPISQFTAPTGVNMSNDPGYQFRLNQGIQALQNSATANGALVGGNTAQALENYAQDYASNEYQNVYNRAQQTYNTNFNTQAYNQNALYSRLLGITGLGQQSSTGLNNLLLSGAGMQSNVDTSAASQIAQQYNNAAAARASGIMGQANAWSGMANGLANSFSVDPFSIGPGQHFNIAF